MRNRIIGLLAVALTAGCADQITYPETADQVNAAKAGADGFGDITLTGAGDDDPWLLDPVVADCGPGTWCQSDDDPHPSISPGFYQHRSLAPNFAGNGPSPGDDEECTTFDCAISDTYVCPDHFYNASNDVWPIAKWENRNGVGIAHVFKVWGRFDRGDPHSVQDGVPRYWYAIPPGPWSAEGVPDDGWVDNHGDRTLWSGEILIACYWTSPNDTGGLLRPVKQFKSGFGWAWVFRSMNAT